MLALWWAAPCSGAPTENAATAADTAPAATAPSEASADDQAGRVVPRKTGGDESRAVGGGQPKGGGDVVGWLRPLGALAVVAGLIFAVRWLLRRWAGSGPAGQAGPMEVLARASVAPRQQLLLVRLGKRLVLIGAGGGTMTTLAEVSDQAEVDELMQSVKAAHGAGLAGLLMRQKKGFVAEPAEADEKE
jgi:flagellar biosynthetic protein FliO